MNNFEFQNPTQLLFGKGQIAKLKEVIPASSKVLVAYGGGSIKHNGVYDQVMAALNGYEVVEFSGIEANPQYATLMKAVEIIKEKAIDFILAVGGGSVIDGVKFISAAVPFEGEPWDILEKNLGKSLKSAVPFGTVLTLPATGSEMNSGSVISRSEIKEKRAFGGPLIFPKFSILDPEVVASLPSRQIANGVIDAFTHVMEQYITYPAGAFLQDRFAEGILQTLVQVGPKVMADPKDYESASNFMWCATMALNGILRLGVPTDWATHMIGHELTALYGIDHARTLAIIAPNLYRSLLSDKQEKLAQYGERVWGINEGSQEERALAAIDKTVEFFHLMEIQTNLSDYTDDYQDTASIIVERFEERGWKKLGEKGAVTPEKVAEIVENSY
ncbi:iron-containing alcohol dehydrogenase [Persicobacter diffluens]|uniref:NADH-dependent alcohol dehydrogenase n=1 Tax=Persicobacter diffluens TaxID=981 RepID=A0AAN5ALR5_9BACT|nr:NADH-dependent alcohol dehydrogenase [Persicobacter diffluens]